MSDLNHDPKLSQEENKSGWKSERERESMSSVVLPIISSHSISEISISNKSEGLFPALFEMHASIDMSAKLSSLLSESVGSAPSLTNDESSCGVPTRGDEFAVAVVTTSVAPISISFQ